MRRLAVSIFLIMTFLLIASLSMAGERRPIKPSAKDRCPVCGMFVAKYLEFHAEIIFKDGSYAIFDGIKDMFKYYFNLEKYNPSKKSSDIDSMYVTDYYDVVFIDAHKAYYVLGSNVYGPMGRELIAFTKEKAARQFMTDHQGKSPLKFNEITHDLVKGMDGDRHE